MASAITGAGAAERPRAVRWDTGKTMILVWLVTIPASAAAGLAVYLPVAALAALRG